MSPTRTEPPSRPARLGEWRRDPRAWLVPFAVLSAASLIDAPWPRDQLLQHVGTAAGVATFVVAARLGASRASLAMLLAFLAVHVLGARWVYSYVPYDDWSETLTGVRIGRHFGFARNHYDRFVHATYGVLATPVCVELLRATVEPRRARELVLGLLAVLAIAGTSALYELGEWLVAVVAAPDRAELYLGQQGDAWDAQKDMAFAVAGSIASAVLIVARRR